MRNLKKYFIICFFIISSLSNLFSQTEIYPVISGVALNPNFTVRINAGNGYENVPVQDIVDVCFAHFAISGSVDIEITVSQTISSYRISPENLGITAVKNGNKLTFTLNNPAKLIILINAGAGNHTTGLDGLCIIADAPEVNPPKLTDANVVNILNYNVDPTGNTLETSKIQQAFNDYDGQDKIIYFPPGIYKSGMLHMRSKQSLYLAPGAVLMGSSNFADYPQIPGEGHINEKYLLGSWQSDNIRVFGRGIINGNGTALRLQDPTGTDFKTHNIQFMGSNNVIIEDIISLNAGSWSVEPIMCDNLTIRNMKVMSDLRYYGTAKLNTDGIDINKCQHVLVENCLVWSGDDAISPKQDNYTGLFANRNVYDHIYRNIIVYTRKNGARVGSETLDKNFEFYNMLFENFDVVYADRSIGIYSTNGALLRDITFSNFRIEKTSTEYKQMHIHCAIEDVGNSIKNINFINISAKAAAPNGSVFEGANLGNIINGQIVQYYNIHFSNYTIAGQKVLGLNNSLAKFNLNNSDVYADPSQFTFDGGTTQINSVNDPNLEFDVYQNPLIKKFTVKYNIKNQSKINMSIRNISGQLMETLIDREVPAGNYTLEWENKTLPVGVYLLTLRTNNFFKTIKFFKM